MDGLTYTKLNEGCRLTAYRDSVRGVWTIGYGCTGPGIIPGVTWTQAMANTQARLRYNTAMHQAAIDVGQTWDDLDPIRQAALTDMAYQMGGTGLAKFRHMLAAVAAGDWQGAHDACLASDYATQTPERAHRNAAILLTGQWQPGYGG